MSQLTSSPSPVHFPPQGHCQGHCDCCCHTALPLPVLNRYLVELVLHHRALVRMDKVVASEMLCRGWNDYATAENSSQQLVPLSKLTSWLITRATATRRSITEITCILRKSAL
jgi:hypothetical protein